MKSRATKGYSSVSAYVLVDDIENEMDFLRAVFQAEIREQQRHGEGQLAQAEARIGDTIVMLGKAHRDHPAHSPMYVWRDDVEAAYKRALQCGAVSMQEPRDQFYGKRKAGIIDPQGNTWWIAQVIEKLTNQEIEQRLAEQRKQRM